MSVGRLLFSSHDMACRGWEFEFAFTCVVNAGKSYIKHISENSIGEMVAAGSSELPLILAGCAESQQLSYAFRLRLPEVVNRPFLRSEYGTGCHSSPPVRYARRLGIEHLSRNHRR